MAQEPLSRRVGIVWFGQHSHPKNRGIASPEVDFKALLILDILTFQVEPTAPVIAWGVVLRLDCLIHRRLSFSDGGEDASLR